MNLFKSEQKHDFKGNFPFRHKNRRMCKVTGYMRLIHTCIICTWFGIKLYDKSRLQAQTKLHFAIMICPTIHLNVTQNVPKSKWWWLRSVKIDVKKIKFDNLPWSTILPEKKLCRMKIPVMKAIRLCDLALVTDFISSHDLSLVYHLISYTTSIKGTSFYL